tara:strand:- start:5960 stop:6439 length:480 start_codon:yes stop_codon:yes gene_type:complete
MFNKSIIGFVVVAFGFLILTVTIFPISQKVNALRTTQLTDAGLACATGAGETSCTVTLSALSAYEPVAFNGTVTETSPSSVVRTSTSILNSSLNTVTISGLTQNTSYLFDVQYYKVTDSVANASHLDSLLKRFNLLYVVGTLLVLVIGVGLSFNYGRSY